MDATNHAVLDTIAHDVLAPVVVEEALAMVVSEIRAADAGVPGERHTIETELARVEAELDRLIGAIAAGRQLDRLLDAVRSREARRADLGRRLAALAGHRPARATLYDAP